MLSILSLLTYYNFFNPDGSKIAQGMFDEREIFTELLRRPEYPVVGYICCNHCHNDVWFKRRY